MKLNELLSYFGLECTIENSKYKVHDLLECYEDEYFNSAQEVVMFGIKDSLINEFFHKYDEESIPEGVSNLSLNEMYEYIVENGIKYNRLELLGIIVGAIAIEED